MNQGGEDPSQPKMVANRYRLGALIGRGAMADVFRATDTHSNRDVAIKLMHEELVWNATASARFQRETRAIGRLQHPSSVELLDWGRDEERTYLALELVEGENLFESLKRRKRFSPRHTSAIAIELCGVLRVAHDVGVVHRDLKPENIMLVAPFDDERPRIKVLDFGIAKLVRPSMESTWGEHTSPAVLTRVGSAVGTPSHMAPEQVSGETIDARTDIYACGVLMFEMLTGRLPFKSSNPVNMALQHLRAKPPRPSEFAPVDEALESVVLRCLAKKPDDRWRSAAALCDAIESVYHDLAPRGLVRLDVDDAITQLGVESNDPVTIPGSGLDVTVTRVADRLAPSGGVTTNYQFMHSKVSLAHSPIDPATTVRQFGSLIDSDDTEDELVTRVASREDALPDAATSNPSSGNQSSGNQSSGSSGSPASSDQAREKATRPGRVAPNRVRRGIGGTQIIEESAAFDLGLSPKQNSTHPGLVSPGEQTRPAPFGTAPPVEAAPFNDLPPIPPAPPAAPVVFGHFPSASEGHHGSAAQPPNRPHSSTPPPLPRGLSVGPQPQRESVPPLQQAVPGPASRFPASLPIPLMHGSSEPAPQRHASQHPGPARQSSHPAPARHGSSHPAPQLRHGNPHSVPPIAGGSRPPPASFYPPPRPPDETDIARILADVPVRDVTSWLLIGFIIAALIASGALIVATL